MIKKNKKISTHAVKKAVMDLLMIDKIKKFSTRVVKKVTMDLLLMQLLFRPKESGSLRKTATGYKQISPYDNAKKFLKRVDKIAGDDATLKNALVDKCVSSFLLRWAPKPGMTRLLSVVNTLQERAQLNPRDAAIYKDIAISPPNPFTNHSSLIMLVNKKPFVAVGDLFGSSAKAARKINNKYKNTVNDLAKDHYAKVFDFIQSGRGIMAAQPKMAEVIKQRLNNNPAATGGKWPS